MDVRLALEKLSQQASSYTVVLNGRVSRDITRRPLTGDSADVYEGTLIPDGTKVAVKTIHADPPSSQESIKVRILLRFASFTHRRHIACPTGSMYLVETTSREYSATSGNYH